MATPPTRVPLRFQTLAVPVIVADQAVVLLGLNFFDENVAGVRFRYRRIGNKGWIDLA